MIEQKMIEPDSINPLQSLGLSSELVAQLALPDLSRVVENMFRAQIRLVHTDSSSTAPGDAAKKVALLTDIKDALSDTTVLAAVRKEYLRSTAIQRELSTTRSFLSGLTIEKELQEDGMKDFLAGPSRDGWLRIASARNCILILDRTQSTSADGLDHRSKIERIAYKVDESGALALRKDSTKTFRKVPSRRLIGAISTSDFKRTVHERVSGERKHPTWIFKQAHAFLYNNSETSIILSNDQTRNGRTSLAAMRRIESISDAERRPTSSPEDPASVAPPPPGYLTTRIPPTLLRYLVPYFTPEVPHNPQNDAYQIVSCFVAPDTSLFFALEGSLKQILPGRQ